MFGLIWSHFNRSRLFKVSVRCLPKAGASDYGYCG